MTPQSLKNVLVTGGAKRIGRAIVKHMVAYGYRVIIHYHQSQDEVGALLTEVNHSQELATLVQANLADHNSTASMWQYIDKKFLPVHCLINNASIFVNDNIRNLCWDRWQEHLITNLWSPISLIQQFVNRLPEKSHGNVINILDQRVWNLKSDFFSYTISKSALWTATQTLAMTLAPYIRVNAIGPGPTLANYLQTSEHFANQCKNVPLQHGVALSDITLAIDFILQNQSFTGQMLAIDGGEHLL